MKRAWLAILLSAGLLAVGTASAASAAVTPDLAAAAITAENGAQASENRQVAVPSYESGQGSSVATNSDEQTAETTPLPWDPPPNAPDPPGSFPCGIGPGGTPVSSWQWNEPVSLNVYKRHVYSAFCGTPGDGFVPHYMRLYYRGYEGFRQVCWHPGVVIYNGFMSITPYEPLPGEWLGSFWSYLPCTPEEPVAPPWVTVSGQVVAPVNLVPPAGVGDRPLKNAKYELWYYGKDGAGTPIEWRPVLDGLDSNQKPSGQPVRGALDSNGAYQLDFVYPQSYPLGDGAIWEGCPEVGDDFLRSRACAEADLQLRIYPESSDRSVIIEDFEIEGEPLVMHTVNLGRFYQWATGDEISTATSEWALAYRGVYNVRDIWTPPSHPTVKVLINDDGQTNYDPNTRTIRLDRSGAGYDGIEHETAHLYQHHVYGYTHDKEPECQKHFYTEKSGPKCAFSEGLASFVSAAAHASTRLQLSPSTYDDIEECTEVGLSGAYDCDSGGSVEGNVAGLLWDFFDTGIEPDSREPTGLSDDRNVPFMTIMKVIASAKPETVNEFLRAWAASSPYHAPDRELAFLNRISMVTIVDAELANVDGQWNEGVCDRCAYGDFLVSAENQDGSHVWDLNSAIASEPFRYDVWIRLPGGQLGLDPDARYQVKVQGGVEEISVNQHDAVDGWINLDEAGFLLDPSDNVIVTLANGALSPTTSLVADGLLMAAHLD